MRALLIALVAVSLSSVPALAADAQTEEARQHFLRGQQFFELARWDDAISEFEQAYAARNDPTFIYNMAQAYRRKGDARRALDLYKNYLIKAPKSMQRAEVEERIAALQKQVDEGNRATTAPAPAPVAASPAPPGSAAPVPAPAPAAPALPAPAPPATAAPAPAVPAPAPFPSSAAPAAAPESFGPGPAAPMPAYVPPSPPPSYVQAPAPAPAAGSRGKGLRVAGIVCGATGLAAIAAGAFFSLETDDYSGTVEKNYIFNPNYDDRGKLYETLQWVGYGLGAGLLATGAVLYGLGLSAGKDATVAIAPTAVPGGAGLGAQGAF